MPYSPPAYEAIGKVANLHELPRFTGGNDIPTESSKYSDYFTGAAMLPVFLFLMYLIWSIVLCCPCCRRCTSSIKEGGKLAAFRIVFVIMGVGACGALVASYTGAGEFRSGFNKIVDSSNDLRDTFSNGISYASKADKALATGIAACERVTCVSDQGSSAIIDEIKGYLEDGQQQLSSYTKDSQNIEDLLDQVSDRLSSSAGWIAPVALTFLAIITCFLVMYIIAVVFTYCDKHHPRFLGLMNYIVYPSTLIGLFFVMLPIAVVTFIGIVSADFCVDPDANVIAQLSAHASTENAEIMEYYVTCEGVNRLKDELEGVREQMDLAVKLVETEIAVDGLKLACNPDKDIDALVRSIKITDQQILNAIELSECETLNPIYVETIHDGYCTTMFNGNVVFFGGVTFACIMLLTMLSLRGVYDTNHPNDDTEENEKFAKASELTGSSPSVPATAV